MRSSQPTGGEGFKVEGLRVFGDDTHRPQSSSFLGVHFVSKVIPNGTTLGPMGRV